MYFTFKTHLSVAGNTASTQQPRGGERGPMLQTGTTKACVLNGELPAPSSYFCHLPPEAPTARGPTQKEMGTFLFFSLSGFGFGLLFLLLRNVKVLKKRFMDTNIWEHPGKWPKRHLVTAW